MPNDLLQVGSAAGGGGILGVFMSWIGFKSRMDRIERAIESMTDKVVFKDLCDSKFSNLQGQLSKVDTKLDDILNEVKDISR